MTKDEKVSLSILIVLIFIILKVKSHVMILHVLDVRREVDLILSENHAE